MKNPLLFSLFLSFAILSTHHAALANTAPAQTTQTAQPQTAQSSDAVPVPSVPTDPNAPTLLESMAPNDSELSRANMELLAKNNELSRQVEDLNAQVNVLVQERSGQLFIYGASTALISVILGFILAKFLTRQRW